MSFGATPGLTPDARTAYGLWTAGQRDEARAMRDAVLKAPERQGMFATRFDRSIGSWRRSGCPGGSDYYSSEECSDQMSWLLRMHQDLEPHPETLRRAQRYVDFLTDHRMRSGAVPTWYDAWMRPEAALRSAASTAVSALCTMRLARITGLKKHLAAAAAMARFVTTEAIAERMYLDSTCISADGFVSLRCADPHTGMHAESSQAMLWCADMCFEAYALFGDKAYLRTGVDVLDRLCLMQSVGEKSWMQAVHGVLARGNTDTRVAPVLTADFAYCAMRYGAATGSAEYCERAAAALRAAQVCAGRGSEEARVHAIAAVMEKEFGSLYVSLAGKWSVELNGCKVDRLEISGTRVALETEPEPVGARVVFSGLRARSYEVSINGRRGCYAREQMEAGISV